MECFPTASDDYGKTAVAGQKKTEVLARFPPISLMLTFYGFIGMYMGSLGLPISTL